MAKLSKGTKFWFAKDYHFEHASGETENLIGKLLIVEKHKEGFIYAKYRERTYLLPTSARQIINTLNKEF